MKQNVGSKAIGKTFGEVGIQKKKSLEKFYRDLENDLGQDASEFLAAVDKRSLGEDIDVHSIKNSNIELANRVFSQYDADRVREFTAWLIRENILADGQSVLEIGCDNGVFLCVCAILFPKIRFTGLDSNHAAIERAQQRAEAKGLKNVQFRYLAPDGWVGNLGSEFDLIVTQVTMHEVLGDSSLSTDFGLELHRDSEFSFSPKQPVPALGDDKAIYLKAIISALKPHGRYLSMERITTPNQFHAWTNALYSIGFEIDYGSCYKVSFVNHEGDSETMPVTVAAPLRGAPKPTWEDDFSFWIYDEFLKIRGLSKITDIGVAEAIYSSLSKSPVVTFTQEWQNGSGTLKRVFGTAGPLFYLYSTSTTDFRELILVPKICVNEIVPGVIQEISAGSGHVWLSKEIHDQSEAKKYGLNRYIDMLNEIGAFEALEGADDARSEV